MNNLHNKDTFWQQIRGGTILAVILIHCYSGNDFPLNTMNGFSYFITRNLVNFPVDMFFFMSGFFMKPVDDVAAFYKKRLPKLVVLTYFTLLSPFLMKSVDNKKISILVFCSTPAFIIIAFIVRSSGTDIWNYLKYTPVWLSFYYLGMYIKSNKPSFNRKILWALLLVAFICELLSTYILRNISGFNAYTQLRFAGAFYSLIIILIAYEYSKEKHSNMKVKWLTRIGYDSYAIYYMHCACLMVFTRLIKFEYIKILPIYHLLELLFAVLICEIAIFIIRKLFKSRKIQMIFGV